MLNRRKNVFQAIFAYACLFNSYESTSIPELSDESDPLHPLRLPTIVFPMRYYLHINTRIHEDILDYSGNVTIELAVHEHTNEIVLHTKKLRDFVLTLTDSSDRQYENIGYTIDNVSDTMRIFSTTQPLQLIVGEVYRLEILFKGDVRLQHFGFYRTSYKDENNNTIPIATTQFQPTSARLAFPCFDEPAFKARFVISLTHGSNYSALSNMPVDGKPVSSGEMTTTTFLESPLMPTYLVAFIVSNFDHISDTVNGVEHRLFFPPNSKDKGKRALKNAVQTVTALENYLGIKYALPKLDHIHVEKTYGSGMENWGLITYNKKKFLPTPEARDKFSTLKLIIVQNHEIAHQWFGNLVSPKWWTYAWLNEGFATYFSYIAAELVYPEWRVPESFIDSESTVTFSWPMHRSMTQYVEKESEIRSVFDTVIYQKAACFVKMFHHAIGHKTFIKGVSLFLTRFQYSAADENDLFAAFQEVIDEDEHNIFQGQAITRIMHSWTHNQGIPIVTITRNYDEGTVTIRQSSSGKNKDETWWIPINFATASNPNFNKTTADYIMPGQPEVTINLNEINISVLDNEWLIINKQQTGLMHTIYDERNLGLIAEALQTNHKNINKLNRALLFQDFAAYIDKDLGAVEPLFNMLQYLQNELELTPWNTAADLILDLGSNLYGSKAFDLFKGFIRNIVGPVFHKFYNVPTSELYASDLYARGKIIDVACQADLNECLNYTKTLATRYFFDGVKIEDPLHDIVLCQGIKYATRVEFQKIVDKLLTTTTNSAQYDDITYAIRCVESPENLKYFLHVIFAENSTKVIMNDFEAMQYLTFVYVSNYFSRPILMEFILENYELLCKKSKIMSNMLERISNYVSEDDGQREEFVELLEHVKETSEGQTTVDDQKIGSRIRKREEFRKKHGDRVLAWLKNYEREGARRERTTQQRMARSSGSSRRSGLLTVRYIAAAGFISNLIGLV